MQVTELQVQRSLVALIAEVPGLPAPLAGAGPVPDIWSDERPADSHYSDRVDELPDGLVEQLTDSPSIRDGRLEAVRRRLRSGDQPSAEAVAQRMVGRLVCDRLR